MGARVGAPLSLRSVEKMGGDIVIIITKNGYVSMNSVLGVGDVSDKAIFAQDPDGGDGGHGNLFGPVRLERDLPPRGQYGRVQRPDPRQGTAQQHVMNSSNWCVVPFHRIDTTCWGRYNGKLYVDGGDVGVLWDTELWDTSRWQQSRTVAALDGTLDDGTAITAEARNAYDYYADLGAAERVDAAWPALANIRGLSPMMSVATDFSMSSRTPALSSMTTASAGMRLNGTNTFWPGDQDVTVGWFGLRGPGRRHRPG